MFLGFQKLQHFFLYILIIFLTACTNFLFVPVKHFTITPDTIDVSYSDIFIESSAGYKLHGWKLSAKKKSAGTILFFHGNGDNVSTQLPNTFWLPAAGYDVYIFDYSGYGKSEGYANLEDTINDQELMIKYVVSQLPEDEKLIVMGHSLGGSMAIYSVAHSAFKNRIKTLVTISAFSDYHHVAQDVLSRNWLFWLFQWPLSLTVDNSYRPLDSISLISPVPLLIMHGEKDEIIDIYHAKQLFAKANEPKTFALINSNHNNIFINPKNRRQLLDYLSNIK